MKKKEYYTVGDMENLRITPEGVVERKVSPDEDMWESVDITEEDFLKLCGYSHAYAHRWGYIDELFVNEEAPAPTFRGGAYVHGLGVVGMTANHIIPRPIRACRYDFNKRASTWMLLVTEYTNYDMVLHVTGTFFHKFDAWRRGVNLYNELQELWERSKNREYKEISI